MFQPRYAAATLHRCRSCIDPGIRSLREICVRPVFPDDKAALTQFFEELSPTTVARRFLGPKKTLSEEELSYFTEVDSIRHVAIVATIGIGTSGENHRYCPLHSSYRRRRDRRSGRSGGDGGGRVAG